MATLPGLVMATTAVMTSNTKRPQQTITEGVNYNNCNVLKDPQQIQQQQQQKHHLWQGSLEGEVSELKSTSSGHHGHKLGKRPGSPVVLLSSAGSNATVSPEDSKMDIRERKIKGDYQNSHQNQHQQHSRDKNKKSKDSSNGFHGYHHRSQNVLRIERRSVTVEYYSDDSTSHQWGPSNNGESWMQKSDRFEAPSPNVKKWFTDSADSDFGSDAHRDVMAKVCILGDAAVGKTSYTQRYVNRTFNNNYKWTVGVDFALKVVKWTDNVSIKLQLWDIAGQERFTSMTRVYYKDAHACIIMFDLTQRTTFHNAQKWKKDLDSKCTLPDGSPVPCILLANKCDLPHRQVEQTEIENFCKEQNFIGWTETSVLQGQMIEESMNFLLDEMMKKRGECEGAFDDEDESTNIKLRRPSTQQRSGGKCAC